MRAYGAELVRLPEEVILAHGSLALAALRLETQTLPIVFVRVADAVGRGFVASLAHPGGNVTGFSSFEYDMTGKWLGLLKEVARRADRATGWHVLAEPQDHRHACSGGTGACHLPGA